MPIARRNRWTADKPFGLKMLGAKKQAAHPDAPFVRQINARKFGDLEGATG
jgi:hypothetical protein